MAEETTKMKKTLNLNFEEAFKISTYCLRMNRAHPAIPRNRTWQLQFVFIFINSFLACLLLCYSILSHDLQSGKFAEVCKNTTMVIVFTTITFKYIMLLIRQEDIKVLIKVLESDYKEAAHLSEEDQDTVFDHAQRGANMSKYWLVAGFGTSAIFPIRAFTAMAYYAFKGEFHLIPMFEVTYPQPIEGYKNVPIIFWGLFLFALSFAFYAATMYVGFDPIVPIFMLHVSGQLEILNRRIRKLFNEFEDPKEIEYQLKIIITKLQTLYEFMDTVKGIFSVLYEFMLKTSTFLLPLTAFQIVDDMRNGWINLEFTAFFSSVILHFFLPSYFSDHLMEKSEDFRQAIYSSGWEKCPDKRMRTTILFMITRAGIPMGIRTVFSEINLDAFAEMCRQSYGLFNLMNAAWS